MDTRLKVRTEGHPLPQSFPESEGTGLLRGFIQNKHHLTSATCLVKFSSDQDNFSDVAAASRLDLGSKGRCRGCTSCCSVPSSHHRPAVGYSLATHANPRASLSQMGLLESHQVNRGGTNSPGNRD